jgi:outer membrane protein assembly factor BamB
MRNLLPVLLLPAFAAAAENAAPSVVVPTGAYAIARLDIPTGLGGGPHQWNLALRDGKLANVWFVATQDGDRRLTIRSTDVALTRDRLGGTVTFRTAAGRGRPMFDVSLKLALKVDGRRIEGGYEILSADESVIKSGKGTLRGTLHAAAREGDALPADAAWASFSGPGHTMTVAKQPPLVDDLAKAKPVWRSEASVPTAYGNAPDSRYFTRAIVSGNGGGGSSPVVANGTVYMHYYSPSPDSPVDTKSPYWERSYPDETAFKKQMDDLKATPEEAECILGHFRRTANDHIVAMDASTGATKWHAKLPGRSPNLQTHKHRGISAVPLIDGATLFVPNLAGRLYALNAATGQLKWELPRFDPAEKMPDPKSGPLNPSPLLLGGVLVWAANGKTRGLDPATGKELWSAPAGYFQPWSQGGTHRVLIFSGNPRTAASLSCVDAATGRILWSSKNDLLATAANDAVVGGDWLVAAPAPEKNDKEGRRTYGGWKLTDTGIEKVWDAAPIAPDENIPLAVSAGKVWIIGKGIVRVLDRTTGKTVLERTEFTDMHPAASNPWLGLFGDRVLFSPEGQHGKTGLAWLDPATLKTVGSYWRPTNTETTAYNSQPIVYPILDGRLFVRGGDGVYCYDLRAK